MESVQKILSREDLEQVLLAACGPSAKFMGSKLSKFSEQVMGFMGEYFRLTILYNDNEEISFFMKTLPKFNANQLEYVTEGGIFLKELLLYKNLLIDVMRFAQFGPRCYFIKGEEAIILEDLKSKGFRNLGKMDCLDSEHAESLIKTLAKYHAATVIYEEVHKVKISEKFPQEIQDTCYAFRMAKDSPRQKWVVTVTKCVGDLMRLMGQNEAMVKKFHDYVFEKLPALLEPSKKYRNTLSHDDLWCNNMMFNDEKKCLLVDFQMARYSPPAFDFYVTLLLNLPEAELQLRPDKFFEIYYNTFSKQLKKYNLESNILLSKNEFLESFEKYKLAALIESSMYGTHVFIPQELSEKILADFNVTQEFSFLNRSKYICKEFLNHDGFRGRLKPVLELLIQEIEKNQ